MVTSLLAPNREKKRECPSLIFTCHRYRYITKSIKNIACIFADIYIYRYVLDINLGLFTRIGWGHTVLYMFKSLTGKKLAGEW